MQNFIEKFDSFAGIEVENKLARLLERIAFAFLVLMVLSAPHSIAATQIAWLTGMFAWFLRLFVKPRPRLFRTPLDFALWSFFGWSLITSILSYAPDISLDRLRNVALFLIFYFVIYNLRNIRAVKFLACALIFSCMVSVVWTPIERIFGRGVEVSNVSAESVLKRGKVIEGGTLTDGDTIIEVGRKKIRTPESLIAEIEKNEVSRVKYYRPDYNSVVEINRADLPAGETALERLGIGSWKHSRVWRSAGFYGHYATFAEVLQLIASLAFGLFVGALTIRNRKGSEDEKSPVNANFKGKISAFLFSPFAILLFCLAGMSIALLLTATRASQLAFFISAAAIVLIGGSRKIIFILALAFIPIAIIGLVFLQQSRKVGFFDTQDDSIKWRQTVYREGFELWTANPRHFFLGVGMDSIQRYAKEWRLFDDGKLPMGHFHSTPLQLVVERGLPALLLWLWILGVYARTLFRYFRSRNSNSRDDWISAGIVLGCLGGAIGFFSSGLVHYNLGDAEVAMVFFLLMGLSVFPAMRGDKSFVRESFVRES